MGESAIRSRIFPSPWGHVGVAASPRGLVAVVLPHWRVSSVRAKLAALTARYGAGGSARRPADRGADEILDAAERQIAEYFEGRRRVFDLEVAPPSNVSGFTLSVWRACSEIPYGETRSYGWVAARIGRPRASRAVGRALGANPLPLVVPCHRVIRSNGGLGGFGGGLDLKERLLELERKSLGRDGGRR